MSEETPFRNISHQQLDDDEEFVHGLEEAWSSSCRRRPPDGLLQICVRSGVVQLNSLYATKVVVEPCKLRIGGRSREGCLRDEFVGLVIKIVVQVVAQEEVD